MFYYVVRVAPRREESFLQQTAKQLADEGVAVVFPRRTLEQTRRGRKQLSEVALFPGYVFLRLESEIQPELYHRIRQVPGFTHFLKQDGQVSQVQGKDLELLGHFLQFGEVVGLSQVVFDLQDRIQVISGPMQGIAGEIIHVDRRKKRAKIRLSFDQGSFTLTLGFEVLAKTADKDSKGSA